MTPSLEINIHNNNTHTNDFQPHHSILLCNNNKRQSTMDSGYHSADDLTSFASSPTTSTSSRRSSLSSSSSLQQQKRQPAKSSYPATLKSAHERIEYLEEQLKSRQEHNNTIIKDVSFQIDTFLKNRKVVRNLEPPHCNTDSSPVVGPALLIDKLNELKKLVSEYNIIITKDKEPGIDKKLEIFFSTQIVENWINNSATLHKSKQDAQNVDSTKHHRLSQAIQTLSKKHTCTKKQLRTLVKSEALHKRKLIELQRMLYIQQQGNTELKQDKDEIEQLLDEVRREMENMMEELNQVKLEKERYLEKSKRYEDDLKAIQSDQEEDVDILALQSLLRESETQIEQLESDHLEQINSLSSQNKDMKTRLEAAQRSNAELSLVVEVQKRQKANTEMEQALRRTVAERDGELAKVKFELEKNQRHTQQMKLQRDKQMQLELNARLEELEQSIKNHYKKESDTYQVQISRDVRNLTAKTVELETELEDLERQHEQDLKKVAESRLQLKTVQDTWQKNEESYKQSIYQLEQKSHTLEREVLLLYGKNLELAQHLGELDS